MQSTAMELTMKPRTKIVRSETESRTPVEAQPIPSQPAAQEDDPDEILLDEFDRDDERWDAFLADDDERDPQPEFGDFWITD
jgi:hypothetical protein